MSYQFKNLSALGYANGFTLWHYRTSDKLFSDECPGGYFSPASRMLRVGDFIMVNYSVDTDEPGHAMLVITSNKDQKVKFHVLSNMDLDPTIV